MEIAWILILFTWFGNSCIHPSVRGDYRVPPYRTYVVGNTRSLKEKCFSYNMLQTKDFILYFKTNQYQLNRIPEGLKTWILYAVYGSADSTGPFAYNLWLSLQRATWASKEIRANIPIGILPGFHGRFILIKAYKKKLPDKTRGGIKWQK